MTKIAIKTVNQLCLENASLCLLRVRTNKLADHDAIMLSIVDIFGILYLVPVSSVRYGLFSKLNNVSVTLEFIEILYIVVR